MRLLLYGIFCLRSLQVTAPGVGLRRRVGTGNVPSYLFRRDNEVAEIGTGQGETLGAERTFEYLLVDREPFFRFARGPTSEEQVAVGLVPRPLLVGHYASTNCVSAVRACRW